MPEPSMPDRKSSPRHDPQLAQALGVVSRAVEALGESRALTVALSGGPDSVALLGLLERLSRREGLRLSVAHVHHGLREASDAEASACQRLADRLGLPFACRRLELTRGPALPERARDARHRALVEMADAAGSSFIALGHTATDQLETLLMHLTRGAGLDGLSAMPQLEARLWRPVLELTRAQTRELCGLMGLSFVDDPTNDLREHFRVELRQTVLPLLRARNPRVEEAAVALSRRAGDADQLVRQCVDAEFRSRLRDGVDGQTWDLRGYADLNREVRTRLLRRVAKLALEAHPDGGRRIIEDVDRALCADARASRGISPRCWALGGGRELWVRGGRLGFGAPAQSK